MTFCRSRKSNYLAAKKTLFFLSRPTGYGNLTPKTDVGKLMTILYALVGIPLMLLYMTNIGHILGSSFKYTYSKFCRWVKREREENLPQLTRATYAKRGHATGALPKNAKKISNRKRGKERGTTAHMYTSAL